jgi:hypothetical protein
MSIATRAGRAALSLVTIVCLSACGRTVSLGEGQLGAGPCLSGTLTSFASEVAPMQIAVDGQSVFWLDDPWGETWLRTTRIMRASESGGPPEVLREEHVQGYVLADDGVYWTESVYDPLTHDLTAQRLFTMPKSGGTPTLLGETTVGYGGLVAADAERLYFFWPTSDGSPQGVSAMPKTGGALTPLYTVPGTFGIATPAMDADRLYWWDGDRILSMPKAGGAQAVLATGQPAVDVLLVDESRLYWQDQQGRRVLAMPKTGGTPAVVTEGFPFSYATLMADDACLYWLTVPPDSFAVDDPNKDDFPFSLLAVPKSGGQAVLAASAPDALKATTSWAMDASGLYIADPNGTVEHLAR